MLESLKTINIRKINEWKNIWHCIQNCSEHIVYPLPQSSIDSHSEIGTIQMIGDLSFGKNTVLFG